MSTVRLYWLNDRTFFILSLLISIPIMLINLGAVPFIEDEGIRGLVALEMNHSGDYVTPTLYGEYYFKKPPLWNWILLLTYRITGVTNEFTTRLPVIVFLYLYTLCIYFCYKKYLPVRFAVLNALLFLTCGRILFWDSMLGLIDIAFSYVIFMFFFWIFHFHKREQILILYIGTYFLIAMAFLLKALPALVFLFLTMLVSHYYFRSWKNLLRWQHLVGIITFFIIVGTYLFMFSLHQPVSRLLAVFLDESTQRTVLNHGILESLVQWVSFPFEMIYHFLPWSVLSVCLFHKGVRALLRKNQMITFMSLTFMVNIWVYWTSPEVYPRYLIMFVPLYLGGCLYIYDQIEHFMLRKLADVLLIILAIGVLGGSSVVFMNANTLLIPGLVWKWALAAVPMTISVIIMLRYPNYRIHGFSSFLFAARLGFSLIVLPSRAIHSPGAQTRDDARRVAQITRDQDLYLYNHDSLRYEAGFYLTSARGSSLTTTQNLQENAYMLMNHSNYSTLATQYDAVDSIRVRRSDKYVYLVKKSNE